MSSENNQNKENKNSNIFSSYPILSSIDSIVKLEKFLNQNKIEKKEELIKNGSLGSIKEESQKKELISSSNKASGEKNKEKEEEKQSVKVDNIKKENI